MTEYEYKRKDGTVLHIHLHQTFHRLTIMNMYKINGRLYCDCRCECGNVKNHVYIASLLSGNTKSCGCLNQELKLQRNLKHGCAYRNGKSRLYKIWVDMRRRCHNANRKTAKNYHDKGIICCDEWNEFSRFYEWSISHGYSDNLTLERKDNLLGYCPENCTWIPFSEQSKNRTSNHYITYKHETHTLTEWARLRGLKRSTIYSRLCRGLDVKDVLGF